MVAVVVMVVEMVVLMEVALMSWIVSPKNSRSRTVDNTNIQTQKSCVDVGGLSLSTIVM